MQSQTGLYLSQIIEFKFTIRLFFKNQLGIKWQMDHTTSNSRSILFVSSPFPRKLLALWGRPKTGCKSSLIHEAHQVALASHSQNKLPHRIALRIQRMRGEPYIAHQASFSRKYECPQLKTSGTLPIYSLYSSCSEKCNTEFVSNSLR